MMRYLVHLWLIYTAGFRLRFGLQLQWLHGTMQKFSHCMESDSDSNPNCQLQERDWSLWVHIWVRLPQCKWTITHARTLVWRFAVTGDDDNSNNDDDDDTFYTTWYFFFLFTTMVCTFPCLFANSNRFVYMMSFTMESFIKATFNDILIHFNSFLSIRV